MLTAQLSANKSAVDSDAEGVEAGCVGDMSRGPESKCGLVKVTGSKRCNLGRKRTTAEFVRVAE